MTNYIGDFATSAILTATISTANSSGAAVAPSAAFVAADLLIYKGNSTTQRASTAGVTVTSPFDGTAGLTMVTIDTSDNTDAGFYAAGNDYHVILQPATTTVDAQLVVREIAHFSIQNRKGMFKTQLTENYAADGTAPTIEQALFLIQQYLGEFSISGATNTVKKLDGSTTAASFLLNSSSNPTGSTRIA